MTAAVLVVLGVVIALGVVAVLRAQAVRHRSYEYAERNPKGWPPEGHLCLVCGRFYDELTPPDRKVCAGCLAGCHAESEVPADDS